jgi:DNA polymerase-3 subunit alpha
MDQLNFKSRDFVHLHLHSDYSLLQSTIKLKPLASRLTELDMKACALTDYGNMYGAVSFYKTMKEAKVRPIVDTKLTSPPEACSTGIQRACGRTSLLQSRPSREESSGYQNLVYLSSKAFTEGLHYKPRLDKEILAEHGEGLIALSGGMSGAVSHFLRQGDVEAAERFANIYKNIFGKDFYIEIGDYGTDESTALVRQLVELARKNDIPTRRGQ